MAKTYTFKIVSVCAGGEHVQVRLLEDGISLGVYKLDKTDMLNSAVKVPDMMESLIYRILKNSGATTAAARKTAIEGASIIL